MLCSLNLYKFITKDFEIIFDTNESDNRFILQRRFDAIIASLSS